MVQMHGRLINVQLYYNLQNRMISQTALLRPNQYLNHELQNRDDKQKINSKMPPRLQAFIQCLQNMEDNQHYQIGNLQIQSETNNHKVSDHNEHPTFCASFERYQKSQQRQLLRSIISNVNKKLLKRPVEKQLEQLDKEFNCKLQRISYCIQHWVDIILRLNKKRRKLTIINEKRVIQIYLRQYLMRKSKKHPHCIVLQNIGFAHNGKLYNYHIKFTEQSYQYFQLVQNIKSIIVECQSDSIYRQINQQKKKQLSLGKQENCIKLFLTQKNIQKFQLSIKNGENSNNQFVYQSQKESQENSLKTSKFEQDRYKMVKQAEGIQIEVCQDVDSLYRVKINIKYQVHKLKFENIIDYYRKNKMIFRIKMLERLQLQLPDDYCPVYHAFYQKIIWKDKLYAQLLIAKQELYQNQPLLPIHPSRTLIFTLKNIDHYNNENFIENLQMNVKNLDQAGLEINIFANFSKQSKFSEQVIIKYLQKFKTALCESKENDYQRTDDQHEQFLTTIFPSTQQQSKKEQEVRPILKVANEKKNQKVSTEQEVQNFFEGQPRNRQNVEKKVIPKQYLKTHFRLTPTKEKCGKIMKEHFLWSNWRRAENGGLVCKNQELVDKQKKMFKVAIKKFGETLLMGKNIINFSLPVIVFKKQSHLQSLAKSYLYSPIFTQKAASLSNPLERMKFSIILMMTENALSIHMQKPFNPILGQTFQGYIDGCPIYLEQVSHHPPISAYYLIGRGFKKYGCIQPKISVGLNTGSGYSIFPHYVEFDDGNKIQYICAKIVIGGLLIGERTFNFQDKIYAYDRKHRYFASLKFGPITKGFFTSSSEPDDYFHGYIYQVTAQFESYFDKKSKAHPQQQHIVKKLTFFDGIWNSSINVNGQEIVNFKTDLPYQFVYEQYPLASDSRYRQDLSNLLAGDLAEAQIAKQQMEELQRHDRKLRQQYAP